MENIISAMQEPTRILPSRDRIENSLDSYKRNNNLMKKWL